LSEFYKMMPLHWDRGTDNLTLEQEAAYLRICNAIYAADQPISENHRTLAGMWRCNERKAKRLLADLIEAGKVYVEDGWIKNDKALNDVSIRLELRVKRQLAGHSGGIESGKSRAKHLKTNDTCEANGSTRREVEEEEKQKEEETPIGVLRKRAARKPEVPIPEDWCPSDRNVSDAEALSFSQQEISHEADKFRDHHLARGSLLRDWDAGWRTWLRNVRRFANGRVVVTPFPRGGGQGRSLASIAAQRRASDPH
jgi:uncharacterized protein YdaU (DUF1376 family)